MYVVMYVLGNNIYQQRSNVILTNINFWGYDTRYQLLVSRSKPVPDFFLCNLVIIKNFTSRI